MGGEIDDRLQAGWRVDQHDFRTSVPELKKFVGQRLIRAFDGGHIGLAPSRPREAGALRIRVNNGGASAINQGSNRETAA
jgi:hypothetical protein